jgi:hypothetical protein
MAERIVLAKSFDPQGSISDDWWFLVIEDGGEMHVEHKRVRHNPLKRLRKEIRTRNYSVKELLATTRHEPRVSLRVALKQRSDLAEIVEASQPTSSKRGPYKKEKSN